MWHDYRADKAAPRPHCQRHTEGVVSDLPRRTGDGLFTIMLRPCTAEVLRHLFDPEVPFVWVVGHSPHNYVEWWTCHLPLSTPGVASALEVRGLRFDLLLPTSVFLARLADFDGVVAYQMKRWIPNTLTLEGLEGRSRDRVLVQNGLAESFYLPHAMECASFTTVERAAMEKVLSNEAVQKLAY